MFRYPGTKILTYFPQRREKENILKTTCKTFHLINFFKYGLPSYPKPLKFTGINCLWNLSIRILIIYVKPYSVQRNSTEYTQVWQTLTKYTWDTLYFAAFPVEMRAEVIVTSRPRELRAGCTWHSDSEGSVHNDVTRWRNQVYISPYWPKIVHDTLSSEKDKRTRRAER